MLRPAAIFLYLCFSLTGCGNEKSVQNHNWNVYLGDSSSTQYSALDQINRENVASLKVAWIFHTGDQSPNNRSQIQCNPIVIDRKLYATTPFLKVIALDAASGELMWTFDPYEDLQDKPSGVSRGLAYWQQGEDRRVFHCASHYLYALDAHTGLPVANFGKGGRVDLRDGLDRDIGNLFVSSRTPGVIYRDLLIQGSVVSEGPGESAPGHVRAYDVRTGNIRWIFHTIPHPGEFGSETWPEGAWKEAGGANSWSGMSLDEERGLVFIPTGSPSFDFWGGDRHGRNLFGNCILALRAETGQRVWHFQTVHHDLWDRDLPAPPNLVTVVRDGRDVDAIAQITKSGHVFLLGRETGEPLFQVEEHPAPTSDLIGEETWPTQPLPVKPPPFARQRLEDEDVTDISPDATASILKQLSGIRRGPQFVPPSTEGTLIFPGFDGGGEWGGAAYDPITRVLYVNSNEMPWILTMVDLTAPEEGTSSPGRDLYGIQCGVCHGAGTQQTGQLARSPSIEEIRNRISTQQLLRPNVRRVIELGKGFMPSFEHLTDTEKDAIIGFLFDENDHSLNTPAETGGLPEILYSHTGYNRFLDQDGYPAVKPPWGTLNAIDLSEGQIKWQVPLGEFPELSSRGIPQTGTENYGGPVVTAGGLIFIGATQDEKFRAIDKVTGDTLWEASLPAGGYATPATYAVEGKQYVVIAAGGGKMGTKSGDAFVAFTLPD